MTITHETEPPERSGVRASANAFTKPKEGDREMIREELNQLLIDASKDGDAVGVRLLLEAGADANTHNDYAIRVASFHGRAEVVKVLLKSGANVHARDDYAIRSAVEKGHTEVVKILTDWEGAKK